MVRRRHIVAFALVMGLAFSVGAARLARATTYVAIADSQLLRQAQVVAEITVLSELPPLRGARASTDHLASIGRVVKGDLETSTIVVRTLGGSTESGERLFISSAPNFREGDRALLFLIENHDGTFSPLHMALGVFFKQGEGPSALARRRLDEATLLDHRLEPTTERVRDYGGFLGWLTARARGGRQPPDYFLERPSPAPDLARPYTLMEYEGNNVRWFDFDDGETVDWRFRPDNSTGTRTQFEAALGAWQRGPVELALVGDTTSSSGFGRSDGASSIIFGDPNESVAGTYSCGDGGTLASGGWWAHGTGQFRGQTYARIVEAEIVINDGVECLLEANKTAAAELFTHELGHTLGIGHSCGDGESGVCGLQVDKNDATMRATLHNDGRGASVRPDDNAALAALYGAPVPEAQGPEPSGLTAHATSSIDGRLGWVDNSVTETGFEIWRAIGGSAFRLWRSEAAEATGLEFTNAKPGKTYRFQVRGVLGDPADGLFTKFSNSASITMPAGFKRPRKVKVRATGPTTGRLTWKDKSNGETKFRIERKVGSGPWKSWRSAPADATSLDFDDGRAGETYGFRVQARKGARRSRYSKIATVAMPQ